MFLHVKHFDELTKYELYAILMLRVSVFVVEQQCPYQELDNLDQDAIHVWLEDDDGIEAYLRILDRGVENENVAIGRVLAAKRGCGLGALVPDQGIRGAKVLLNAEKIYIEAQSYARGFYEKQGFRQVSDEFLLDGIPHVRMILE